ncbi:MAG: beta-lactamase family protein, partial [Bacteroidia bacterium]|nr:beta-lactamase family protein [Bacteroidia bacterium]
MIKQFLLFVSLPLLLVLVNTCSNSDDPRYIVPESGYDWPDNNRAYWPTDTWQMADPGNHDMDASKLELAHNFASNDELARALLVVKDGYLVFEEYYHDGDEQASTNLWSVTKSFASAITGLVMDDGQITSVDQFMVDLMPQYPEFETITLKHVLTHTTGLSWSEEGPLWVEWIMSDDWVREALSRRHLHVPGSHWKYSSGNTHFLSALVKHKSGQSPGKLAKSRLFDPMGIPFEVQDPPLTYSSWWDYFEIFPQSWHQDPQGNETASFGLFLTARDMAK